MPDKMPERILAKASENMRDEMQDMSDRMLSIMLDRTSDEIAEKYLNICEMER